MGSIIGLKDQSHGDFTGFGASLIVSVPVEVIHTLLMHNVVLVRLLLSTKGTFHGNVCYDI